MSKRKTKKNRRTYKFQLREHPKNVCLGNMLDDLADVHNHFLKLEKRYYRRYGKYAGRFRLQPHLTKLLGSTKQHWAWIPRDTLDEVIIRIHITYNRFFDGLGGLPKFKRKDRYRSAKFQSAYLLEEGRVRLSFKAWDDSQQRLKFNKRWFSFHQHRDYEGKVCYIQILRDRVGTYWLYVITDDSATELCSATGESVGIDFGMETYLTFSNGEKKHSPEFFKRSLKELRTLNKSLSRKVKGSHNWWRAVGALARLYRHIANQRRDWHYKVATDLCERFDTIVTETLNLAGMKRLWRRKISDLVFGEFVLILQWTFAKHGKTFLKAGRWEATTKPCSSCGHHNETLTLQDRQWICAECGSHHDRDISAAINILQAGVPA